MLFRVIILFALLYAVTCPARAEKRIALVIGNRDYKASVGPLANPLNDIRVVADALKADGFALLSPVENATRNDMLRAIYGLASALKAAGPDAVGFLYYSGHGLASAGENYLVPIDLTEPSTEQLRIQGVKQSEVLACGPARTARKIARSDAGRDHLQRNTTALKSSSSVDSSRHPINSIGTNAILLVADLVQDEIDLSASGGFAVPGVQFAWITARRNDR